MNHKVHEGHKGNRKRETLVFLLCFVVKNFNAYSALNP